MYVSERRGSRVQESNGKHALQPFLTSNKPGCYLISVGSVINNYVSCFHVRRDVEGSGSRDHPRLDVGCKEHNTFHRRIMMPIDHLNLKRVCGGFEGGGEFGGGGGSQGLMEWL